MTDDNWVNLFPILPTKAKEKKMAMLVSDEPLFSDLIKNYDEFTEFYTEQNLLKLQGIWDDNSNNSNYRTIEDLLENLDDADLSKSHIVTVDIKDIFSSEASLGGFDRPLWSIKNRSAIDQQHENLNLHGGYCEDAAGVLSAKLRPHPTMEGCFQLVKYLGNNRLLMKLLANNGESTRVPMMVSFHKFGLTQKDYISIESSLHATDAGNRSGQNENQKFISGLRAERPNEKYTFEFLRKNKFNYNGIMQQEGVKGSENWIYISSLQGIKTGPGNGNFGVYGEENMSKAMRTVTRIAKEITGEQVVGATPIMAFANMYSIYTQCGKSQNSQPLFTDQGLEDFFIALFLEENSTNTFGKKVLKINDLSMTGSVKDIAYICGNAFWPQIVV